MLTKWIGLEAAPLWYGILFFIGYFAVLARAMVWLRAGEPTR